MAKIAIDIITQNGYDDVIKVVPLRSTELVVEKGGYMEEKANILVTEVFDTELIGEGVLPTLLHAHQHLLEVSKLNFSFRICTVACVWGCTLGVHIIIFLHNKI